MNRNGGFAASINKAASSHLHSDSPRREDSSVTYNQDSQKGSSQRTSHFRGKLLVVTFYRNIQNLCRRL